MLKAGPSWVKLKLRERERPRGFTDRILSIKYTNKQRNRTEDFRRKLLLRESALPSRPPVSATWVRFNFDSIFQRYKEFKPLRMISADVFDKKFPYFSLRTGPAPVRKIADKWLYK